MTEQLPAPPVPPDADLRDFPFIPVDVVRLFNSTFHAQANDSEWRAGATLWFKSWHQVPASSLPDNDVDLCRLAELGRDHKTWRKLKAMALHGWTAHSDGRLYHPVVAEKAVEAWARKGEQRIRTLKARIAAMEKRLAKSETDEDRAHIETLLQAMRHTLSQSLSQTSVTATKGQGQGQGQGDSKNEEAGPAPPNGAEAPRTPRLETVEPGPNDVKAAIFGAGLAWLIKNTGANEPSCRSFLGSLIGQHGEIATATALLAAERAKPVDPRAWLKRNIGATNGQRPRNHATQGELGGLSPELAGISAALARRSVQPG